MGARVFHAGTPVRGSGLCRGGRRGGARTNDAAATIICQLGFGASAWFVGASLRLPRPRSVGRRMRTAGRARGRRVAGGANAAASGRRASGKIWRGGP